MNERSRTQILLGAVIAIAIAVIVTIAALLLVVPSTPKPTSPGITVTNNATSRTLLFSSNPQNGGGTWSYVNVSTYIALNSTGKGSDLTMDIRAGAAAYTNSSHTGISFVFFIFFVDVTGRLAKPLSPDAVRLVVDNFGNASTETDPIVVAFFSSWAGATPVNLSSNPPYISPISFSGSGSITDSAGLANASSTRASDFRFSLPLQFEADATAIPMNTTATNTFHLQAYLDGLSSTVFCESTVDVVDTYYG
jgi:hypothetical protein